LANYNLTRWHRLQKRFAADADFPPPIVIERKKFRDARLWEAFKRIARSDPTTLPNPRRFRRDEIAKRQQAGGVVKG
jgi:hypothetical protein